MTTPREVVALQAEDEGLWFIAATAAEAYLQQELRRLHDVIEGHPRCDFHDDCEMVGYPRDDTTEWACPVAALHDLADAFQQVYELAYAPAPAGENGVYHHARRVEAAARAVLAAGGTEPTDD